MWALCGMWGKGTRGSREGWGDSFNILGEWDNLGMSDSHGEGCKEWKNMYVFCV